MAGVSTKEIKTRIRSMESTKQITKAMEMVASSKLRHAQAKVLASRPYFESLYNTILDIMDHNTELSSAYLTKRTVKKAAYVVIAGDRGLAGGYNNNVLKLVTAHMEGKDVTVLPVGKKALDYFRYHKASVMTDQYGNAADISMGDCFTVARQLCKAYLAGSIDEVYVVYTNFVSVLSQTPSILPVLPLQRSGKTAESLQDVVYEPDSQTVFDTIVPEFVGGIFYGALCESRASEHAARRTAMDAATQNADEMIGQLSLKFNQARQAAITQEITEIVAGS
jgi:F-type H+-transporting ATPase subunit gamma